MAISCTDPEKATRKAINAKTCKLSSGLTIERSRRQIAIDICDNNIQLFLQPSLLRKGTEKARIKAEENLKKIREIVGFV